MEHTKEPWRVVDRGDTEGRDIDADVPGWGEVTVAMNVGAGNARRIVACVNACAGIPTNLLEAMRLGPADMLPMYDRLTKQRDDLVAALKRIADGPWPDDLIVPDDQCRFDEQIARAALASVEEGK